MPVRFDAAAECLYRTANLPSLSAFTIAAKVQLVVDRNGVSGLWGLIDGGGNGVQFLTAADGTTLRVYSSGSDTRGGSLVVGSWQYLVLRKNGSAINVRLNGVSVIDRTDAINITPAYLLINDSGANWANVRLGHMRVWSAVLSDAEADAEMISATPVRTANLNAAYAFSSSPTADGSGNGNNLTAVGSPTIEGEEPFLAASGQAALAPIVGSTNASVSGGAGSANAAGEAALAPVGGTALAAALAKAEGQSSIEPVAGNSTASALAKAQGQAAVAPVAGNALVSGGLPPANATGQAEIAAISGSSLARAVPQAQGAGEIAPVIGSGASAVSANGQGAGAISPILGSSLAGALAKAAANGGIAPIVGSGLIFVAMAARPGRVSAGDAARESAIIADRARYLTTASDGARSTVILKDEEAA